MTDFADHAEKYQCLNLRRDAGILQMTLPTRGGPFQWGFAPHEEHLLNHQMLDLLGYGLALEGLATMDRDGPDDSPGR